MVRITEIGEGRRRKGIRMPIRMPLQNLPSIPTADRRRTVRSLKGVTSTFLLQQSGGGLQEEENMDITHALGLAYYAIGILCLVVKACLYLRDRARSRKG